MGKNCKSAFEGPPAITLRTKRLQTVLEEDDEGFDKQLLRAHILFEKFSAVWDSCGLRYHRRLYDRK